MQKKSIHPFLFLILLTLFSCAKAPKSIQGASNRAYKAVINNDVSYVWKIYYDNPGVRKNILVDTYRSGRITKAVYQKEMGRLHYYKDQNYKKLKKQIASINSLILKLKIKKKIAGIDRSNISAGYVTLKIGEEEKLLFVNIHFQNINGKYYVVWLYSNT